MTKKRSKTKDKLLSIPKDEMDALGRRVEELCRGEMSFIVNKYVGKYRNATAEIFSWNEDDLLQHIKIIMWKGLATYDPNKKVKLTTYLTTCLYYQMGNLSKTCQNEKNSKSKFYCPEDLFDHEATTIFESSEDWASYSQTFKILIGEMSKLEMKVLVEHLLNGSSVSKMEKKFKKKRNVIVAAIKSLKEKLDTRLGDIDEKNSIH